MRRSSLFLMLPFLLCGGALWAEGNAHVKVEMLAEPTSVQPGASVTIGLHFFHLPKGWHISWKNPGDAGQTPSVNWTLPEGFTVGDILWPAPQRIPLPNLADYGYLNEVLLMVPIQVPANLKPGRWVRFVAHVRWLACNEICIPGDINLNARLVVKNRKAKVSGRHEYLFQAARRALPKELPEDWKASASVGKKEFHIYVQSDGSLSKAVTATFFPTVPNQIENGPAQTLKLSGSSLQLSLKKSDQLAKTPEKLEGLLVVKDKKSTKAYDLSLPLGGEE